MTVVPNDDAKYWVGFSRVPFVGPQRLKRLIDRFGNLRDAWMADAASLRRVLDERAVDSLVKTRSSLSLDDEMALLARSNISVLTRVGESYPRLLAEISAPPPVLYVKGTLLPEDAIAVGVVGTRRCTSYGRAVAKQLVGELAEAGVTIISGLALGIDGCAHQAALDASGRTIAVLGCGVNVVYPWQHRNLAAQIVEHGALVSDYPPDTKPEGTNFPARNRIISGLSLGVLVIEAPAKSGALITTDFAADQGRDVFVVPGGILSEASTGCHRLLRDGARIVTCADEVLEDLNLGRRREQVAVQQALPLAEDERRLLALLTGEPQHIDEVATAANVPIADASSLLMAMELKGFVRNTGAQHYARM